MALLHIFDSSDPRIKQTAGVRGVVDRLPVSDGDNWLPRLTVSFRQVRDSNVFFETHGSPGCIYLGNKLISADWWRSVTDRNYTILITANARVYFNGCNVAEGASGWDFLEAVVAVLLTPGGGEVFAQTSIGFGNPFNGHVVHLWGSTRRLFVNRDGRIIERFEQ